MVTRLLLVLVVALTQVGCKVEEEVAGYKPVELPFEARQGLERLKREFLQLEDLKFGDGPIAAWGRKVTADIEVRYTDGMIAYHGPAISYFGMRGYVFIHDSISESGMLSSQQRGIMLGLNGMAVGGKRRITIHPKLVCEESGAEEANPKTSCTLVKRYLKDGGIIKVRKEKLIVEATLTASCIPGFSGNPRFLGRREVRCRDSNVPQHDPKAPIWRFY